jgi:type VI protein secretion system component VasK
MPPPDETARRGSWLSILLALAISVLVFAALFMLTGGTIALPAAAAFVIFGMAAFHYLVWGWWLSKLIHREVEEEERAKAEGERQKEE